MKALVNIMEEIVEQVNANVIDSIHLECDAILSINYMHGHWEEVSARLIDMGKNPNTAKHKFPLVVLLEDFPEDNETKNRLTTVQILILALTNKHYNSAERQAKIFEPILYPIYWELLKQISRSIYFENPSADRIVHRKWDRKKFGKEDPYGNTGHIPFEFLDALQLQNLQLYLKRYVC